MDFFRRVPKDFTEGTPMGLFFSFIAATLMGFLFVLELKNYLTYRVVTDVVMDNSVLEGRDLFINFDMSMPELVCAYASVDVSDIMGTERQGIRKDIRMERIDHNGAKIGDYKYSEDEIEYEIIDEEEEKKEAVKKDAQCEVTAYVQNMFKGDAVTLKPGVYDVGQMERAGLKNDDLESLKVGAGCAIALFEHGDFQGWEAYFAAGNHNSAVLEKQGAKTNDASSLVIVEGSIPDAKKAVADAKDRKAKEIPDGVVDELTKDSFDTYITNNKEKMVIVDFFAPWCHWCKVLAPVWQQTAEQLTEKPFASDIRMAKIDCVANAKKCEEQHIRAYPTIKLFMNGDASASVETYYGDRTTSAFFTWMEHEHKILAHDKKVAQGETGKQAAQKKDLKNGKGKNGPLKMRQKGDQGRAIGQEGCTLKGRVAVKRLPGNFHVNFAHDSFSFQNSLINATHSIENLSFGRPLKEAQKKALAAMDSRVEDNEILATTNTLDGNFFVSQHNDRTFEHFLQVVPTIYKFRSGQELLVYKYTSTSAEHEDTEDYPSAKFSFQISPMAVIVREEGVPTYHFLTNVCAIVGGLFTVFSIMSGAADATYRAWRKDREGKLT